MYIYTYIYIYNVHIYYTHKSILNKNYIYNTLYTMYIMYICILLKGIGQMNAGANFLEKGAHRNTHTNADLFRVYIHTDMCVCVCVCACVCAYMRIYVHIHME
jgi:hypothetical protein